METREVARRALALLAPGRAAAAPAPPRSPGPARAARHVGLAALLAALGAACAAPAAPGGAQGAPARLYVAHALGDTVAQLDAASGRPAGPPLPAGPLPDQVAPGPGATWSGRGPAGRGAPAGRPLAASSCATVSPSACAT